MLLREQDAAVFVITQTHHAVVSGRIGRAWGNDRFGAAEPREELLLAASIHDLGWLAWEAAPELNAATSRPHSFMDMPLERHLAIWERGPRDAAALHRYAGLLVSLHATGLYARFRTGEPPPPLKAFLEREHAWQRAMIESLEREPRWAPHVGEPALRRNQRLLAAWDALSLALCLGATRPHQLDVPARDGALELTLAPADESRLRYTLDPWPFTGHGPLALDIEGRRFEARATSDDDLRERLAQAPWDTLPVTVAPA
jgi:hypothetical protein